MDIVIFGDSHSLKFSDRHGIGSAHQIRNLYDPSGFNSEAARRFANTLKHSSKTCIADFYIQAFQSFGIFGFNSTLGRGRCHTPMDKGIAYAESKPIISPILMLCATDIDFRGVVLKAILEERLLNRTTIADFVLSSYGALFNLIAVLKNRGCNIMVEGLIPPTASDQLFTLLNGYIGTANLRGLVYRKVDTAIERIMDSIDCPYVSYRKMLATDQGLLKQEYHLDGIHVSSDALPVIIDAITNIHGQSEQNNSSWQHLGDKRTKQQLDAPRSLDVQSLHDCLLNDGIAVFQMSAQERDSLTRLKERLTFSDDVGNKHTRYDWPGNSRIPYSIDMAAARFSHADVLAARDLLLRGPLKNTLSSILGFEYSIYNIRAFLSSVHSDSGKGPQGFHHDGTPPYLYRAVIYMSEVGDGDGPFEHLRYSLSDVRNGKQLSAVQLHAAQKVFGSLGSIILFDANVLLHRGSPPTRTHRYALDLSIGPTPSGSKNFIIAAGMNNWPCDPYCFSVDGLHMAYSEDNVINHDEKKVFNRYPVLESYYA